MRAIPYILVTMLFAVFVGCSGGPTVSGVAAMTAPQTKPTQDPVIYGNDDRKEVYEHDGDVFGAIARSASAVMVNASSLYVTNQGAVSLYGASLANAQGLCSDERFVNQPTPGSCSGTLIDDDLILTAGHCISSSSCSSIRFVFDFYYSSPGQLASIGESDVYRCQQVVTRKLTTSGGRNLDYAIIRTDRPVVGRTPAQVRSDWMPMSYGEGVVVIGFPSGLPAKIEDGGYVQNRRSNVLDYFSANTDTFGGNSGSGVFNDNGVLVGILVRGANDYAYDSTSGCYRAQRYNNNAGASEDSTYAHNAIESLCNTGVGEQSALCGASPELGGACGDNVCDATESANSCPQDCSPPETSTPEPSTGIPSGWTCQADYYDANDGCDCGCGEVDPDCVRPNQQLYGCADGQSCSVEGLCEDPTPSLPEPSGASWTCNASYYDANDGCDCNCGIPDPDCERS
ncbi:MAG: serine protease, partial [Myxococcota bacterium]|nr:serine protease [Myxococcota bacterium]